MSQLYPAIGPLAEPVSRSGVHAGPHLRCACDPTQGQDCPACDGSREDAWEIRKASSWAKPDGRQVSAREWDRLTAEHVATFGQPTNDETAGDAA